MPSRTVALALLAGLVGLTAATGVWGWSTVAALSEAREARTALAEALGRAAEARRKAAGPATVAADPYLAGASETIAAAGLDARLRGLVEAAGAAIVSTEVLLAPEPEAGARRIALQVDFEGPIEAVQAVLHGIESGTPLAFVDALTLRPAGADAANPDAAEAPRLRASLTAAAYWRRRP
jgi:hypothetical protein